MQPNAQQSEAKLRELLSTAACHDEGEGASALANTDVDDACDGGGDGGDVELQTLPAVAPPPAPERASASAGVESSEDDAEEDCALLAAKRR